MRVCEWFEARGKQLDGLDDLLLAYDLLHRHLVMWLDERNAELTNVPSPTTSGNDGDGQIDKQRAALRRLDETLANEHASFVRLSQVTTARANKRQTLQMPTTARRCAMSLAPASPTQIRQPLSVCATISTSSCSNGKRSSLDLKSFRRRS